MGNFVYKPYATKTETAPLSAPNLPITFPSTGGETTTGVPDKPIAGVGEGLKFGGHLVKEIGQDTARDWASTFKAILSKDSSATIKPDTKVKQFIFGKEEFSQESQAVSLGTSLGVSEEKSKKYGAPLIGALSIIDMFTLPGKKSALKVLTKEFTRAGMAVKTAEDAAKVLRTAGATDDVIYGLRLDEGLAAAKTESDVMNIFKQAAKATHNPPKLSGAVFEAPRTKQYMKGAASMFPEKGFKTGTKIVARSTAELAERAQDIVRTNPEKAVKIAEEGFDDFSIAVASELLNDMSRRAASQADVLVRNSIYDEAARIANTVADRLVEHGRSVQAATLLSRQTDEGIIRWAAQSIKKYNRENPFKKLPELSGEQVAEIQDMLKSVRTAPNSVEKAVRMKKVQDYVQDLLPSKLSEKIAAIWKAGLLTGPPTIALNFLANAAHFATEIISQVPAAIADSAFSLFTNKRTISPTLRGAFAGLKEGTIKGKRYFFTGFDERNIGAKIDYKRVNFGKGPVAKFFKTYTEFVFRSIGVGDQPFYYAANARSLMDQALAQAGNEGLRGRARLARAYEIAADPTEEMVKYSMIDATTAVFQNETLLGKMGSDLQKTEVIGQYFVPFARTPSAVATQIMNYTPVGPIAEVVKQIRRGKFDQRLMSQAIGRGTVGVGAAYIGYALAEKGLVKLDYPQGDERQIELDKAEGVAYNSILIHNPVTGTDTWRSPIVLGPAGNVILFGAHIRNSLEKSGSPSEAVAEAAFGVYDSFTEQTFLTGFANFAKAVSDFKREGWGVLSSLIASAIPTGSSIVARALDPTDREQNGLVDKLQARTPGLRNMLEPKVDIIGRDMPRDRGAIATIIDPTRSSQATPTAVTEELKYLMDSGVKLNMDELRVSPTKLGDKQGYPALTEEQNTEMWRITGRMMNEKLSQLFLLPEYRQATIEQRAEAVDKVAKNVNNYGRAYMVLQLTDGLQDDELKARLVELKEGGLLTETVYKIFLKLR